MNLIFLLKLCVSVIKIFWTLIDGYSIPEQEYIL